MPYNTFSSAAPTGEVSSATRIISYNQYSSQGRSTEYPTKLSLYVTKQDEVDGSFSVVESHQSTQLVGSRLYLYHRPLANVDGSSTTITSSDGTINSVLTNIREGSIVFSVLPTGGNFTISYAADADDFHQWEINTLCDDMMQVQKVLGPTADTTYPGLRNLKYGIFDMPNSGASLATPATSPIYLSHLNADIRISSSTDPGTAAINGTTHTIYLGYQKDTVDMDLDTLKIHNSNGATGTTIYLGQFTGDKIYYKGAFSGEGQATIGGPAWPGYSGSLGSISGSVYSGAMLRINGDVAVLGTLYSVGPINVVHTTGNTSSDIEGTLTVRNDLYVYGTSHLIGPTQVNTFTANTNIQLNGDLLALNTNGSGGGGQSLIDNLDPSEVAVTYRPVTKRRLNNAVIAGPTKKGTINPATSVVGINYTLTGFLCGDTSTIDATLNAPAGPSGAHPNIIQLLMGTSLPIVSGFGWTGHTAGIFSPGLLDPGTWWIEVSGGGPNYWAAPIYGYTIEGFSGNYITRLNVFTPEAASPNITGGTIRLFNPKSIPAEFITSVGGTSPTATVFGTSSEPLWVAFDGETRVHSSSSSINILSSLENSISGLATGSVLTGVAYIFADSQNVDMESSPVFLSRHIPYGMPGEVPIGEITASRTGSTWTILDTTSYRPGSLYDSTWIPIMNVATGSFSGRMIPPILIGGNSQKVYFNHQLGCGADLMSTSMDLYLGAHHGAYNLAVANTTQPLTRALQCQDQRFGIGISGAFIKIPLNTDEGNKDASVFYMDSRIVGIELSSNIHNFISSNPNTYKYLRLVARRDA